MAASRTREEKEEILEQIKDLLGIAYQIPFCIPGHDIDHIIRVLAIADKISALDPDSHLLLKVAIWFHNLDRTTYFPRLTSQESRIDFILWHLIELGLTKEESDIVLDAVSKHNRLNEENDSPILVLLKDADRLDMGAIGILRITKVPPNLPFYTLADFLRKQRGTRESDLTSVLHGIERCLEWEAMLRSPKAIEMAKRIFPFMRAFTEEVKRQLKELGLL